MAQPLDSNTVLELLLAGNRRWAQGVRQSAPSRGEATKPLAALVCCAELGPTPERLFSRPVGSLFILQGASVCLSPSIVAGLAYAVETLTVRLVVIMAHTGCALVDHLSDGASVPTSVSPASRATAVAQRLERTGEFAQLLAAHDVGVVPLMFEHDSARVRLLC